MHLLTGIADISGISGINYVDFPDPEQIHDGTIIYHSSPPSPQSDGGYRDGTVTQDSVDRWRGGINSKYAEGSSDSVRASPPSSSNGDDINPFQAPDEDGSELALMETREVAMDTTHSTLHDIDL